MLSPVAHPDGTTVTPHAALSTCTEILLLLMLVGLLLNEILPVYSPPDPYQGGSQNVHLVPPNAKTKTALITYAKES